VWGLGITTVLFAVISLITSPPEGAEDFIRILEQELKENGFRLIRKRSSSRHFS